MGLAWQVAQFGRRRIGCDTEGREYAFAIRALGVVDEWDAYIQPVGCGDPKGVWLRGGWADPADATEAADRYVVAYVDSVEADG